MDIFRKDDGSTIIEGKRKIYSTITPMKLMLPDGKDDGILEEDDLIYVNQKINKDGNDIYRFMVLKFADTDKVKKIYSGDAKYFRKHFDEQSNAEGYEKEEVKEEKNKNYKVPIITGAGIGIMSFLIAKKYQKNAILFGIGGFIVGAIGGYYLSNKDMFKKK